MTDFLEKVRQKYRITQAVFFVSEAVREGIAV
jgi:hypothetical protein